MKKQIIWIVCLWLLVGCDQYDWQGLFSGSSEQANTRFDQSMTYNDSVGYSHWVVPADYKVYVCTDSHVDSTAHNLQTFVRAYRADTACALAIHLGDLTTGKERYSYFFNAIADASQTGANKRDTLFYTIGNHDLFWGQWETYRKYVPTTTYWFDTQTESGQLLDLFIGMDSGEGTLGAAAIDWLRTTLRTKSQEGYRHIIVFTHTNLFQLPGQGLSANYAMEEMYELLDIFASNGVSAVWTGHAHKQDSQEFGGVEYTTFYPLNDALDDAQYAVIDMDNLHITTVRL